MAAIPFRLKVKIIHATMALVTHTSKHKQPTMAEGGWHFTIIGKVDILQCKTSPVLRGLVSLEAILYKK